MGPLTRIARRPFALRLRLGVLSLAVALGACGPTPTENPNLLDESVLAPALLDDRARIVEYLAEFPEEQYEIVDVPQLGKFYLDDNPAWVKRFLRTGRIWEPKVQRVMARHAAPGTTALDIGAHIGSHTLALARMVGPDGAVYAFEPQKKIFRELVKNLELNGLHNVVPLRFAVGASHEVIEMSPTEGRDGLMQVGAGGDEAELRTLDSFGFRNVSLIKIDVEGYELAVLQGAVETIRAWHPAIVVEILAGEIYEQAPAELRAHVEATRELFDQLGYELIRISCEGGCDYLGLYMGDARPE